MTYPSLQNSQGKILSANGRESYRILWVRLCRGWWSALGQVCLWSWSAFASPLLHLGILHDTTTCSLAVVAENTKWFLWGCAELLPASCLPQSLLFCTVVPVLHCWALPGNWQNSLLNGLLRCVSTLLSRRSLTTNSKTMSFGVSPGDFVSIIQLAFTTVQNARKACDTHDALTREVTCLHVALQRLETELRDLNLFPTLREMIGKMSSLPWFRAAAASSMCCRRS